MDVIVRLNDGTEATYNIFISGVHMSSSNYVEITCRNYRASGLLKPVLALLSDNPSQRLEHLSIKFKGSTLLNFTITDYCYKLKFISTEDKPFTEILCLW